MATRRSFFKTSALLSAGLLASPQLFAYDKKYLGLQLYTVRDAMAKYPSATLTKVAQIGYNSVEGATYTGNELFYGMDPKTFAKLLNEDFSLKDLLDEISKAKHKGVYVALSIDGNKKSGNKICDLPIPEGLFEQEIFIDCGKSMLRRFQVEGQQMMGEGVFDRLLLTYDNVGVN